MQAGQWGYRVPIDIVVASARLGLILALAGLALLVLERRRHVVTRFVHEESTALNLAVARVVVMGAVLWETRLRALLDFAALDPALLVAPRGWGHIASHVPLATPIVVAAYAVLLVTATLGLIGLAGRTMCGLTALTAFYLHTIPQLFGKVNHTINHLVLFSVLLAIAPSCDTLSVDAIRAAVRDADQGLVRRIRPARAYSLALQTMMLYIGLAYFFPGAWKVARAGTQWFSSDHMQLLILAKLQEFPMSPFRHWVLGRSALLGLMAVATIVFELGFVFAILVRRLRPAAALAGLAFHEATAAVMGIRFAALQVCYVVFIDWTRCLRWVATRRRLEPITLRYDAADAGSRRFMGVVVACDWLDLVRVSAVASDASIAGDSGTTVNGSSGVAEAGADGSGAAISGRDEVERAVAARIPLLWLVPAPAGARAIHSLAGVANARTARTGAARIGIAIPETSEPRGSAARDVSPALRYAAVGLLGSFAIAGVTHFGRTWPIACYPAFDVIEPPNSERLSIVAIDSAGRPQDWTLSFDPVMGRRFGTERWRGLVAIVLSPDQPFDSARARALLETWRGQHAVPRWRTVTLYGDAYALTRDASAPVIERRRIGKLTLAAPE
jgi:hypothetical protein